MREKGSLMPNISRSAERLIFLIIILGRYMLNQRSTHANVNRIDPYPTVDTISSTNTECDNGNTQRELEGNVPGTKTVASTVPPTLGQAIVESKPKKEASTTESKRSQERLIVHVGEEHMYWHYGQRRLCQMLQDITLTGVYQKDPDHFRDPIPGRVPPKLVTMVDCDSIRSLFDVGHGNWVSAVYSSRMAAARAKVDYSFSCQPDTRNPLTLLLPWLEVEQKAPTMEDPWPYTGPIATVEEACSQNYTNVRLDKFADQIVDDMQRMAVTLLGDQKDGIRQHPSVPIDQTPIVPDVVLDDVVVDFRCGDVMGGGGRKDYGMIKFTEYLKWIHKNETKRIGILTQPFDVKKLGRNGAQNARKCKAATYLLRKTLQNFLPEANITIHNGDSETIPLVYARLVMAKQAFISLSSLTIFPIMGTFGKGYFQKGNNEVTPFSKHLPARLSHLTMMEGAWLTQRKISKMSLNATMQWFVTAH